MARKRDGFAVDRYDDVVRLEPGLLGRFAGADGADVRVDVGQDADVADFEAAPRGRLRRDVHRALVAVAHVGEWHLTVRLGADRDVEIFPGRHRLAGHLGDAVARLESGAGRDRVAHHRAEHDRTRLVGEAFSALVEHHGREDDREAEVHHRPHDEHLEALPLGARHELFGATGRRLVRVLARHLHVAAERQRADAVFGVAAANAQHRRIEAQLELQHLDANTLGREEVPELVHEHEDAKDEREPQERSQCASHRNLRLSIVARRPYHGRSRAPTRPPRGSARGCLPPPPHAHPSSAR